MQIKRAEAILGEVLNEEPEESGFSDTRLTDHEGEGPLLGEILESCQGLGEAVVVEDPFLGRTFLKGVIAHFEVIKKHDCYSFFCRICLSS